MPELSRVRPESETSLTRGRLYILVAVSICMSATTFVLGRQIGRQEMPAAPLPPRDALISEEARTGNLELLLQKVSLTGKETHLAFPADLPQSPPPPPAPVMGPDGLPLPTAAALPAAEVLAPPLQKEGEAQITTLGGTDVLGVPPLDGFSVQVAVTDTAGARTLLGELATKGVDGYAIDAIVDGQPERRVRVGGYTSEEAATAALPGLQEVVGGSPSVVKAP